MTTSSLEVLARRARMLAKPRIQPSEATAADTIDVLIIGMGEERLAMPVAHIVAIARVSRVTPLPHAVAPVYGVCEFRGRALTVLSVGAAASSLSTESRIIVLGDGGRAEVALLVDSVDETIEVSKSKLSPAPSGPRSEMAIGVTGDGILVLDTDTMLNAARTES